MIIGIIIVLIFVGLGTWFLVNKFILKKNSKTTPKGMSFMCDTELDESYLKLLDSHYDWAVGRGMVMEPKNITLTIIECPQGSQGNYRYEMKGSPTGYAAGEVDCMNPVLIKMCRQTPEVLKHEFKHVILFQKNGDPNNAHTDPIWAE